MQWLPTAKKRLFKAFPDLPLHLTTHHFITLNSAHTLVSSEGPARSPCALLLQGQPGRLNAAPQLRPEGSHRRGRQQPPQGKGSRAHTAKWERARLLGSSRTRRQLHMLLFPLFCPSQLPEQLGKSHLCHRALQVTHTWGISLSTPVNSWAGPFMWC